MCGSVSDAEGRRDKSQGRVRSVSVVEEGTEEWKVDHFFILSPLLSVEMGVNGTLLGRAMLLLTKV